jgi:hypothetical protein
MDPDTGEVIGLTSEQRQMRPLGVLERDGVVPISNDVADLLRAGMRARNRSERRTARRLRLSRERSR